MTTESLEPRTGSLASYLEAVPKRGGTTDAVTDALREAILDGMLQPNTWLREDELARELSVSRTPIREALRRLADEGLAHKSAHHGTLVAPVSLDDVIALYAVRSELEGLAAKLAAQRCPPGLIDRLQDTHRRMADAGERGVIGDLAKLNLEFHRAIRSAAGNAYLDRFLRQVEHAVRRLSGSTFQYPERVTNSQMEHQAIIEAIARQDGDTAAECAREHLRAARDLRIRTILGS